MEHKSEGICRFCLKKFSSAGMGRHLSACKTRKDKNALELKTGRKNIKYTTSKFPSISGIGCTLKSRQVPRLIIWMVFCAASGWSAAAI